MKKRAGALEWMTVSLDDLIDRDAPICYGIVVPGPHDDDGVRVVKVKDMVRGTVRSEGLLKAARKVEDKYKRSRLKGGDLLLSIRGTVGRLSEVPDDLSGANITQDTARLRISESDTRAYVLQALQSDFLQRQIRDKVVGQAVRGINIYSVRRLQVPLPRQLHDRRAIADLLGTWDDAIGKVERLASAKDVALGALRERLLNHPVSARPVTLASVTHESTGRNGALLGRDEVMGVIKGEGLRPMRARAIAGDISRYKVTRPGAFAYNPMRINIGSIAMSSFERDVLVSPDYVVFECKTDQLLPAFMNQLRFSSRWRRHIDTAGNGSVRVRIYYEDLAAMRFPLPDLDQQARIAGALDAAQAEVTSLEALADRLKAQKRGLMQQLLTGKRRLPASEEVRA